MKTTDRVAVMIGLDVHRQFSTVTTRNAEGKIAWRQRLEHEDHKRLRTYLEDWPQGITGDSRIELRLGVDVRGTRAVPGEQPQGGGLAERARDGQEQSHGRGAAVGAGEPNGSLVAGVACPARGAGSPGVAVLYDPCRVEWNGCWDYRGRRMPVVDLPTDTLDQPFRLHEGAALKPPILSRTPA